MNARRVIRKILEDVRDVDQASLETSLGSLEVSIGNLENLFKGHDPRGDELETLGQIRDLYNKLKEQVKS